MWRRIVEQFYPIAFIPTGVRLTAYGGGASNLPSEVLADIVRAHEDMEHNRVTAKQVVLVRDRAFDSPNVSGR